MLKLAAPRPWPTWAEAVLADIAGGAGLTHAARRAGISHPAVCQLAKSRPDFGARLEAARRGNLHPLPRPAVDLEATALSGPPGWAGRPVPEGQAGEGLVLVAVAVVRQAYNDAARGDSAAAAWLAQLRADVLEDAPAHLARRVGRAA